jgi:protein-arginine kinase activator protein McsA
MELPNTSIDHISLNISEPTFQEILLNVQGYANCYQNFHNAMKSKVESITSTTKEILDRQARNEARAKMMSDALDEAIKERISKLEKKIEARNFSKN